MTISINQILVFCLVAVLIVFLAEMAILVKHALPLIAKLKGLADNGNNLVDDVKAKANEIGNKITGALNSITAHPHPLLKLVGGLAAGATAFNSLFSVGGGLALTSGLWAALAGGKDAKKAKRDIKKSKKAVKQLRKQNRIDNKVMKQTAALERKAAKVAAKNNLKAIRYEKKLAKKVHKAQKKKKGFFSWLFGGNE